MDSNDTVDKFLLSATETNIMQILNVEDALNLNRAAGKYCFRGQAQCNLPLLPTIHRTPINKPLKRYEASIFEAFLLYSLREDKAKLPHAHIDRPVEFLAFCQHYGVPTRFLDWSNDIKISLYFACEKELDKDGELFVLNKNDYTKLDFTKFLEVVEEPLLVDMTMIHRRIKAQDGCFLMWGYKPFLDTSETYRLEEYNTEKDIKNSLEKYTIPAKSKITILKELDQKYGINHDFIYSNDESSLKIENAYSKYKKIALTMMEEITSTNPSGFGLLLMNLMNLGGCVNSTISAEDAPSDFPQYLYQLKQKLFPLELIKEPKIGRNELCPCGNGKKYKHCHGA